MDILAGNDEARFAELLGRGRSKTPRLCILRVAVHVLYYKLKNDILTGKCLSSLNLALNCSRKIDDIEIITNVSDTFLMRTTHIRYRELMKQEVTWGGGEAGRAHA